MWQDKVTPLSTDFGCFVGEISELQFAPAGIQTLSEQISALKTWNAQELNHPVLEELSTDFIEFRKECLTQKTESAAMSLTVTQCHSLSFIVTSCDSILDSEFSVGESVTSLISVMFKFKFQSCVPRWSWKMQQNRKRNRNSRRRCRIRRLGCKRTKCSAWRKGKSSPPRHCDFVILQDKVNQLSIDVERFVGEIWALRSASAGIQHFRKKFPISKLEMQKTWIWILIWIWMIRLFNNFQRIS
jgi:hypothetical protein